MHSVIDKNKHIMKTPVNSKLITASVALMTLFGLALHETKLDVMASLSAVLPAVVASYGTASIMMQLSSNDHTHVERVSVENVVGRLTSLNPLTPTRHGDDKKYRMQKNIPKGHHPFDNYSLPVIS